MGNRSIARRRDLQAALRRGRRARRDGLTVWVVARPDREQPSRLGLAVGRAVGRAVARNRVKRRLRAAFAELGVAPGYDVVARADAGVNGRTFQDIRDDLGGAIAAAAGSGGEAR